MSGAMNSAKSGQTKDSQDPAGTCPLKLSKLQLIPVRYALVESQPEHPAISSRLKPEVSYRHVGVRPIDEGYIYLIHSQRQDIIYVYHIQPDGKVIKLEQQQLVDGQSGEEYVYLESEQGLFVAREGTIEVLFSPTKISPKLQSQLLDSENLRAKMMQTCDVGSFSCLTGSRHLLPTSALESNMADCNPENSDYEEAYRWCWLKDKPQQVDPNELLSQIEPEFELDSAVLILEDPMGVMTELSNCDNSIINMEVEWFQQDNNRAKYFAATQIKLLIEVGERQFNANTNNEKLMNFIKADEEKLKQRFIDYTQAKKEYWSFVTDKTRGYSQYSLDMDSIETSHEFQNYQYQRQLNLEMAERIGIAQSELEFFFHQVKKENDDQVEGEFGGWLGDRGILARIEYEDMEAWFSSVQKKNRTVAYSR
ncbi:toxin VasX [Vibrio ostreae]|uniref:Toxin VasX N-terminal region domain-containing protein n=1 Tax=Vibrio ostreae TaxID=2841925 RepID=A0A975YLI7_9VIBR|nr:toxin VasX [Vibrio ostreae]QXO15649.1 hypothetical protein KNV97_04350 [Vibrio ostreae]